MAAAHREADICIILREEERAREKERKKREYSGRFIAKIQVYLHPSSPAIKNRKLSSGYWSISKQRTGCAGLATGSSGTIIAIAIPFANDARTTCDLKEANTVARKHEGK